MKKRCRKDRNKIQQILKKLKKARVTYIDEQNVTQFPRTTHLYQGRLHLSVHELHTYMLIQCEHELAIYTHDTNLFRPHFSGICI